MTPEDLVRRSAEATGAPAVIAAITEWWPGVQAVPAVCRRLFAHLGATRIPVEEAAA